jgi:DNA-binding MarR family transcriptional regulator
MTNTTTDTSELAPLIIGKLLHIGGLLQRNGNRMLLPLGLNQQQFSIFFEIANVGKVKQKDMVNRLLLEKAHVSKVVKKLNNMGLITVTASDEDKRSAWLAVTKKGENTLTQCMKLFGTWNSEWVADMNQKQLASALEFLTQLQAVFKDHA